MNEVYKVKETATGGLKAILRDDQFNPPADSEGFAKASRSLEVLYEGAMILGPSMLLEWGMAKNMVRPKSDYNKSKNELQYCSSKNVQRSY